MCVCCPRLVSPACISPSVSPPTLPFLPPYQVQHNLVDSAFHKTFPWSLLLTMIIPSLSAPHRSRGPSRLLTGYSFIFVVVQQIIKSWEQGLEVLVSMSPSFPQDKGLLDERMARKEWRPLLEPAAKHRTTHVWDKGMASCIKCPTL